MVTNLFPHSHSLCHFRLRATQNLAFPSSFCVWLHIPGLQRLWWSIGHRCEDKWRQTWLGPTLATSRQCNFNQAIHNPDRMMQNKRNSKMNRMGYLDIFWRGLWSKFESYNPTHGSSDPSESNPPKQAAWALFTHLLSSFRNYFADLDDWLRGV